MTIRFGLSIHSKLLPTRKKRAFKVGTAVVDIFDTKTKKLLFRGASEDEISEKREANQEKIDKGVEKMFKDFPPT